MVNETLPASRVGFAKKGKGSGLEADDYTGRRLAMMLTALSVITNSPA